MPTKKKAATLVPIEHLHTLAGFAFKYGMLTRKKPYSPSNFYSSINKNNNQTLTILGRDFEVLQIDDIRIVVWDGSAPKN